MARTVVNIPGAAPFTFPGTLTADVAVQNLRGEYPAVANMQADVQTAGDTTTITFSQRTGTKG